jgi:N-hydroxyarylamine O-acetyltransferase
MNGILGWALQEIGFKVTRATGAVMRETSGEAATGNHLVLRVDLDEGTYLADVGFGEGPIEPFAVTPGGFRSNGFTFEISRVDNVWWRLRNHLEGGAPSFDFNLAPAIEPLLALQCHRLQTAPESIFVQNALCFRHTASGLSVLRGRVLRSVTPAAVTERVLADADEFQATVEKTFGLNVPDAASLWPAICARHDALFRERETA